MAEAQVQTGAGREIAVGTGLGAAGALAALWAGPAVLLIAAGAALAAGALAWAAAKPYRWLALFCALTFLTPPLPFELGSTGPHLALVAAFLGACAALARNPRLRLPESSLGLPLTAYVAVLACSAAAALWISGPGAAGTSLVRTGLLLITPLAYLALRHGRAGLGAAAWIRGLLTLGVLTALLGCADFLLQLEPPAGYGEQMVWLTTETVRRAQGVFYDAAQFGNVCAFFLIGTAAAALHGGRLLARPLLALGAVALAAALVFSFSRGAMLHAAAGLAAMAVIERRALAANARTVVAGLGVAAASAAVLVAVAPEFTATYGMRFAYTAWRAVADPAEALGMRLDSWGRLLGMLAEHPERLLLGVGYKTLAVSSAADEPLIVDNQWLAALGETGLLGLAALAWLVIALLRGSWQAARSASPAAALLGVWSFCFWAGQLVQMLFVDLMTYWRVLPVYAAVLALAEREAERRTT